MKLTRRKYKINQRLKCYEKEMKKYMHLYNALINKREAKRIIETLKRHFKIKTTIVGFNYKDKYHGGWANSDGVVSFRMHRLNLGIVCHECCHLYCYKKKIFGHSNKFYTNMNKFTEFIEDNVNFYIKIRK